MSTPSYPYNMRKLAPSEGGGWLVAYPDLPECMATGETQEEARLKGERALTVWLKRAKELNIPIPEPGSAEELRGNIRIRVSKNLHMRTSLYAQLGGISVNEMVTRLVNEGIELLGFPSDEEKSNLIRHHLDIWEHEVKEKWASNGLGREAKSAGLPSWDIRKAQKYTGSWMQRFPEALHVRIKHVAEQQGISMNMLINILIAEGLTRRETLLFRDAA